MKIDNESVLVLDFGGQYAQLIARRVREQNVFCEIKSYKTSLKDIKQGNYKGIIFTGGPNSVYEKESPKCDRKLFDIGVPILGICYGAQLMAHMLGGTVKSCNRREYGMTKIDFDSTCRLFAHNDKKSVGWMSHTDYIARQPKGFKVTAFSAGCPVAAMEDADRQHYAVQFHPEVEHTEQGREILHTFLFDICGCVGDWVMSSFVTDTVQKLKAEVGDKRVLLGLSGGVDSTVAAVLVHKAIGKNLTCIFVDHGLMRKNEGDEVERVFREQYDINMIRVDAEERFLTKLAGVTEPEDKRKIIGEEFIRVFEEESQKLGKFELLCQGTIYPDVVESGEGEAATIKSHHNVGGLPENIDFDGIVEPLRDLFKDEVRAVGKELEIPRFLVWRQPFPGPGLAIRIIGEITKEKLELLREADFILRDELAKAKLDREINQFFAVLTGIRSVGVMGDGRTYSNTIALRAVTTSDFMTADWARIPYDVLNTVSNRIINEVSGVNRIVYDITSKPPSTIEWE